MNKKRLQKLSASKIGRKGGEDKPRGQLFDHRTREMSMHDDDVLISPSIGQRYPVAGAFVYSVRAIAGGRLTAVTDPDIGEGHRPCRGCPTYSRRSCSPRRLRPSTDPCDHETSRDSKCLVKRKSPRRDRGSRRGQVTLRSNLCCNWTRSCERPLRRREVLIADGKNIVRGKRRRA